MQTLLIKQVLACLKNQYIIDKIQSIDKRKAMASFGSGLKDIFSDPIQFEQMFNIPISHFSNPMTWEEEEALDDPQNDPTWQTLRKNTEEYSLKVEKGHVLAASAWEC